MTNFKYEKPCRWDAPKNKDYGEKWIGTSGLCIKKTFTSYWNFDA